MIQCPVCKNEITPENFNVATNIAYCRHCNQNHPYNELVDIGQSKEALKIIPAGVSTFEGPTGTIVRYKKISGIVFFFIIFTAIWSGGSMFAMGKMISSKGLSFEALFFLPFLLGTAVLIIAVIFMLFGKREIREDFEGLVLFTGVGPLGFKRHLDLSEVAEISVKTNFNNSNNGNTQRTYSISILLKSGKRFTYFQSPNEDAVRYFCAYLRHKAKLM